ncbi:hypothetical protein [Dactylosporangium sp. CA-139066]|uniref:hypothetical protein n=1 Tax=Dactylosporangium sp. CA-139066 TaxID=3239930 RepID=UPI003D8E0F55
MATGSEDRAPGPPAHDLASRRHDDLHTPGDPVRLDTPDGPAWVLRRRADIRAAYTDPRLSPCPRHAAGGDYRGYDLPPEFRDNIISAEPADHRRVRPLVVALMDRAAAARLAPSLRAVADDVLARAGGEFDAVADFAGPYVAEAVAGWIGLPAQPRAAYLAWAATIAGPGWQRVRARDTLPGMLATVRALDEAAAGTVAHVLLAHRAAGRISAGETSAMLFYLLYVWFEVCVDAIAEALAGPGDLDQALAAHAPQVTAFRRFATHDVDLGGTTIRAGQSVLYSLRAAGVDGPDRGHLAFGHGPHRCPGEPVARALVEEAVAAARRAGVTVGTGGCVRTNGLRTDGLRRLRATR